jgi:hypothetical protein
MEISKTSQLLIKEDIKNNPNNNLNREIENINLSNEINDNDCLKVKSITFSDYTNYLLNYPIQNIIWSGNRNKMNKDQLSRVKEVLKFIKFLKYNQDYTMVKSFFLFKNFKKQN